MLPFSPPVPPAITPESIQVSEASDIISWQPPAEPNGDILHYNIRISRVDAEENIEFVITVREVTGTTYNFSMLRLRPGTYNIQVAYLTFY